MKLENVSASNLFVTDLLRPATMGPLRFFRNKIQAIEERNIERYPVDQNLIGKEFYVKRIIVRAGYLWEHLDFERPSLDTIITKLLREKFRRVIAVRDWLISKDEMTLNDEQIQHYIHVFGIDHDTLYQARDIAMDLAYGPNNVFRNKRTFWYTEFSQPYWFQVLEIKNHWIGKRIPADRRFYGEDYGEYEPAYLDDKIFQQVYYGRISINGGICGVEVHPLDLDEHKPVTHEYKEEDDIWE